MVAPREVTPTPKLQAALTGRTRLMDFMLV